MSRCSAALAALLLAGAVAHALSPARLHPAPDRVRCYGGRTVTVRVRAPTGCKGIRWAAWVAGAKTGQGEAAPAEGVATFTVRMPDVKRRTVVDIRVEMTSPPRLGGGCSVRVYPAYDPARLKRLFASARVGVAEAGDEISLRLAGFDCRYARVGGRTALGFFEGDVILASGEWWSRDGRDLAGLLREHLRAGVRIVVVECAGKTVSGTVRRNGPKGARAETVPDAVSPDAGRARGSVIADPRHPITGAPCPDFGLPGELTLVPDLSGNLRRLVVDPRTDRPFVVEELPPEGGSLLRVSLRILSSFDDPAAPVLFERLVEWSVESEPPEWKPVGLRLGDGALAARVRELGIRGGKELPRPSMNSARGPEPERQVEGPRGGKGVALVGPDGITREVTDWVLAGGTAVVLVPGEPDKAWLTNRRGKALRGVTRGLVARLCAERTVERSGDDPWERLDVGAVREPHGALSRLSKGAERRVLALGLLDEADVGRGKVYVLRAGPPPAEGELPRAWREFLVQVFTNLGVRCGEADEDE